MSVYWKQSLWIGGIYWLLSLLFMWIGTVAASMVDAFLSVVMLVFLLVMNWIKPIKKVDALINKFPVISTLLVSIGWVPYVIGAVYIISVVSAFVIIGAGSEYEYQMLYLFQAIIMFTSVRQLLAVITFLAALCFLLARRSVAGRLDKRFKLITAEAEKKDAEILADKAEEKPVVKKEVKTAKKAVKKPLVKKTTVKKDNKPKNKVAESKTGAKKVKNNAKNA